MTDFEVNVIVADRFHDFSKRFRQAHAEPMVAIGLTFGKEPVVVIAKDEQTDFATIRNLLQAAVRLIDTRSISENF